MKIAMKSSAFEDAYVAGFRDIFENKIVFNREIELTIKSVETGLVHAEVMLSGNEAGHIGWTRSAVPLFSRPSAADTLTKAPMSDWLAFQNLEPLICTCTI